MEKMTSETGALYEVGFHIVPSVAEESLPNEVAAIKSAIEGVGGTIVSEEFPKLRPLAYSISKKTGAVKHTYDKAYFGWVKFECEKEHVPALSKTFFANDHILRFLLIQTTSDAPASMSKIAHTKGAETAIHSPNSPIGGPVGATVSDAELDKSIDALVNEQTL